MHKLFRLYLSNFNKHFFKKMKFQFGAIDALYDRLTFAFTSGKPVVFVVGSPLTSPQKHKGKGVLGVNEIVELIKDEFAGNPLVSKQLDRTLQMAGQTSYQEAFEFLILRRGVDYANQVIQRAVLNAYGGASFPLDKLERFEQAEKDLENWHLTAGVESLGLLLAGSLSKTFNTVLTTNFDPLIQIAIAKAGGNSFTTMLHREGNLTQTRADAAHIIHLHGSWRGSDTLHTSRQLMQERVQLKSSLATIARNSLIVAIGYGGWDDILMSTLSELVLDDSLFPEIAWAFYSSSEQDIIAQNEKVLSRLGAGIDRGRVSLYCGIDCHEFFPKLYQLLQPTASFPPASPTLPLTPAEEELASIFDDAPTQSNPINAVPKTDVWYGRADEIERLMTCSAKVIVITGIGGQGKSSLASKFFDRKKAESSSNFFDWKDCREQGNTINLAVCSAIEKTSGGKISIADISKRTTNELMSILIRELRGKNGIIVFDNVDHYIDLETNEPLGGLKSIIDAVLLAGTGVTFVFTARPIVRVESSNFLELRLYGLCLDNAKLLFEHRYGQKIDGEVFRRLYDLTAGHPLWLSIIAAQCYGTGKTIESILEGFQSIGIELPKQMLRQTWQLLNPQQQQILRTLAELERPESEKNIEEITELKFNKLSKALTRLKSMCLIERKVTQSKVEVIDLHPLIRQFVREDFAKEEREGFIDKVILYLDKKIFRFKKNLNSSIPHLVLEIWIHKVDLQINSGAIDDATDTLLEIVSQLDNNGLNEEISRLSKRIFIAMDWLDVVNNQGNFDKLFNKSIRSVIEVEGAPEAEAWLVKYEQSIAGKGAQFINLCDLRAYKSWFNKEFEDAILWAEKGQTLKMSSSVDTIFHCDHTLALAQRDSGVLEPAFAHFRNGLTDEQIFSQDSFAVKNGPFFGNLGRCYYFSGDIDKALLAYQKSAVKLDGGNSSVIDQGYIRFWVGQAMAKKGRREDAILFLKAAIDKWERIAPSLMIEPQAEIAELTQTFPDLLSCVSAPQWKCENRFLQWTTELIRVPGLHLAAA
jgi:tetratricopeptide (TPR) repeat protein